MARTDNLTNFLTDIASAIRGKEGTTEPISARDFDTRIANLSGGGEPVTPPMSHRVLEYIGITGNIYYQLKTKLNNNSRVIAKFTRDLSGDSGLFGYCNYYTSDTDSFGIYLGPTSYHSGRIHAGYGYAMRDVYFSNTSTEIILDANKNTWTFSNFANEQFYRATWDTASFESKYNCLVGATIWGPSDVDNLLYYKGNLYYLQIYNGSTLVHDLVPVKRSDGLVTLYDKVYEEYLDNLGTGEPVAGPYANNQSSALNLFVQEEEPTVKEGLWVQAPDLQVDNIVIDEDVFVEDEWIDPTTRPSLNRRIDGTALAYLDGYLYLFGSNYSTDLSKQILKFNVTTNEWTTLTPSTYSIYGKKALVYDTDIYLIGSTSSSGTHISEVLKYDSLTDTIELITQLPAALITSYSKFIIYDHYIYAFNLSNTDTGAVNNNSANYRYDIEANAWERLIDYPYFSCGHHLCNMVLGDKVWFIYTYNSGTANPAYGTTNTGTMVFDLTTLEFVQTNTGIKSLNVTNATSSSSAIPYAIPIVVDDYCYLYTSKGFYKIPISEFIIRDTHATIDPETYPNVTDTVNPLASSSFNGIRYDIGEDRIFITGFNNTSVYSFREMSLISKEFDDNTLVIRQGTSSSSSVHTQLINAPVQSGRLVQPLYNAIHYTTENGANNSLPLYYGTGTEWIKFRN